MEFDFGSRFCKVRESSKVVRHTLVIVAVYGIYGPDTKFELHKKEPTKLELQKNELIKFEPLKK